MLGDFKYTSLIFSFGCFSVITSYLLSEKTERYKTTCEPYSMFLELNKPCDFFGMLLVGYKQFQKYSM